MYVKRLLLFYFLHCSFSFRGGAIPPPSRGAPAGRGTPPARGGPPRGGMAAGRGRAAPAPQVPPPMEQSYDDYVSFVPLYFICL